MNATSHRDARCFVCGQVYRTATMFKLDGWDAMYYVCGPCVDVLKEHARIREQGEQAQESQQAGENKT